MEIPLLGFKTLIVVLYAFPVTVQACTKESLFNDPNAVRAFTDTGRSVIAVSTCKTGYRYVDGTFSQTFECLHIEHDWSYDKKNTTNRFCLPFEYPYWVIRLDMLYTIDNSTSRLDIPDLCPYEELEASFKHHISMFTARIRSDCSDQLWNVSISTNNVTAFQFIMTFKMSLSATKVNRNMTSVCLNAITNGKRKVFQIPSNTVMCNKRNHVITDTKWFDFKKSMVCSGEGFIQINDAMCVTCGPSQFYSSKLLRCVPCIERYYQDSVHSFSCKLCPDGNVISADQTTCSALCHPGHVFVALNVPCRPCDVDHYSKDFHTCAPCSDNMDTGGNTGASVCSESGTMKRFFSSVGVIPLVLALVVIVVVAGAVCFIIRRRKRRRLAGSRAAIDTDSTVIYKVLLQDQWAKA